MEDSEVEIIPSEEVTSASEDGIIIPEEIPAETEATTFDYKIIIEELDEVKENQLEMYNQFSTFSYSATSALDSIESSATTVVRGYFPLFTAVVVVIAIFLWFYKTFIK